MQKQAKYNHTTYKFGKGESPTTAAGAGLRFCYQRDKEKSADAPANKAAQLKSVRALKAVPASFQSATPIVKLAGRCSAGSTCIGLPPAGGESSISTPANSPPRCIRGGQRKGASAQNYFMRLRARETSQNGGVTERSNFLYSGTLNALQAILRSHRANRRRGSEGLTVYQRQPAGEDKPIAAGRFISQYQILS